MFRPFFFRAPALVLVSVLAGACRSPAETPRRQVVTAVRQAGSWQGTGSKTVGDISSDAGHFRITWEARHEQPKGRGTFRLTVRSAVSGRPLQVVVDHHGEGSGVVNFEDGPRIYDFMVDSTNVEWAFSVEDIYEAYAKESPVPPSRKS